MARSLLEEINACFSDAPIAVGSDVLATVEHAQAVRINDWMSRVRLRWLKAGAVVAYLDITCLNCGSFHLNGKKPEICPQCKSHDIVVTPHDYDLDRRFKSERENMLDRMDIDQ